MNFWKKWIPAFQFVINYRHLNIKILSVDMLPVVSDNEDCVIEFQLSSEDLSELIKLGFYARAEKLSITLS
jgi:hypothetical protein